jgi:hypothetical protein
MNPVRRLLAVSDERSVLLITFKPVRAIHIVVGWAVVGGFGLLWLWGVGAALIRRGPGRLFWPVLAVLQVALLLQGIAGLVLIFTGLRASLLHYVYGIVFPLLVLLVAHVVAREMFAHRPWLPFAVASFFVFGLTLRALATGFGFP